MALLPGSRSATRFTYPYDEVSKITQTIVDGIDSNTTQGSETAETETGEIDGEPVEGEPGTPSQARVGRYPVASLRHIRMKLLALLPHMRTVSKSSRTKEM